MTTAELMDIIASGEDTGATQKAGATVLETRYTHRAPVDSSQIQASATTSPTSSKSNRNTTST